MPSLNWNWRRSASLALVALLLAASGASALAQSAPNAEDAEAAYTKVITQRADQIAASLHLADSAKALRVRNIIMQQYRDLRRIHDARDAQIKAAQPRAGGPSGATNSTIQTAQDEAKAKQDKLHIEYLAKLSAELVPEQVDTVKDGMTYGVLPLTYATYLKMLPNLTGEQKARVMAWLVEAREIAMDAGTSEEKHGWFNKYKGRINNFLSAAGYNLKEAEKNLNGPPK